MITNKKFLIALVILGIISNLVVTTIHIAFSWSMPGISIILWYVAINSIWVAAYFGGRTK